jgi:hypothetical protein
MRQDTRLNEEGSATPAKQHFQAAADRWSPFAIWNPRRRDRIDAGASCRCPERPATGDFSLITEPDGRFAYHLQFALDGGNGFRILKDCLLVQPL